MKKIAIFALILVFVLSLSACAAKPTQLGDSDFSIVLPKSYEPASDDMSEDQIAYFHKDDNSLDFDVYLWEKGDQYTLESEARYFAAEYGTTAEAVKINGIDCWKYISAEEFEGNTYTVVNYMFEDDTYIIEIAFWTINTDAELAAVDEIISTLKKN